MLLHTLSRECMYIIQTSHYQSLNKIYYCNTEREFVVLAFFNWIKILNMYLPLISNIHTSVQRCQIIEMFQGFFFLLIEFTGLKSIQYNTKNIIRKRKTFIYGKFCNVHEATHFDTRTSCLAVRLYFSKEAFVPVESRDTPDIHDWLKSVRDVSISSTSRLSFKLSPPLTIGEGRPMVSLVYNKSKRLHVYWLAE